MKKIDVITYAILYTQNTIARLEEEQKEFKLEYRQRQIDDLNKDRNKLVKIYVNTTTTEEFI